MRIHTTYSGSMKLYTTSNYTNTCSSKGLEINEYEQLREIQSGIYEGSSRQTNPA